MKSDAVKELRERKDETAIVKQYMGLVTHIVQKSFLMFRKNNLVDLDDCYAWGMEGLLKAIRKYNPSQNVKFETYAYLIVKGNIIDNLIKLGFLESTYQREEKVFKSKIYEDYRILKKALVRAERFDLEKEGFSQWETVAADNEELDATLDREFRYKKLMKALEKIGFEKKLVLIMYYFDNLKSKEIAAIMNVSEALICMRKKSALMEMRKLLPPSVTVN